jgi:branched-chain amino acid transport system permease protein
VSQTARDQETIMMKDNKTLKIVLVAIGLVILPLIPGYFSFGDAWVRIIDIALLYVLLALGLNIVVGYAGLLDLGYVAFYAVGAYMFGLLASPQLTDAFPGIASRSSPSASARSCACS